MKLPLLLRFPMKSCLALLLWVSYSSQLSAIEPLPLSTSYWKSPAFLKQFNGSYRIEARIEPSVTTEERALLVKVQELMIKGERKSALALLEKSSPNQEIRRPHLQPWQYSLRIRQP